ncbi:MAG: polysaccharide biosynthesis/export family protein [Verrucomicrobiota bacterium]
MKKQFWQRAALISQSVGLLLLAGLLLAGCATPTTNTPNGGFSPLPGDLTNPVSGSNTNTNTVVGGFAALTETGNRFAIGDQVTIKFSGTVDTIPQHEERIKDDGNITLTLIGAVKAAGKTPGELQKEIHDRYVPDYYKRLTVIVEGEQRVYYVGGQVRAPGRQVYLGATTVTKAIQSAGDFTDFAAKRRVELFRADGKKFFIDCKKAAKDPSLDLPVYPGDKIDVPMRGLWDTFD